MKFQHVFIFVILIALFTSVVDARVILNSGNPTWSDGSTDLTIDVSQSATVVINDISTTFPDANDVTFTVELYELNANGNLIPVVLTPRPLNQVVVPVPQGGYLDYSFNIDPVHFGNQAGDYRVDIQIEEGRPDQNIDSQDAVAQLTLHVVDTPQNQAPQITRVGNEAATNGPFTFTVKEGNQFSFVVAAADADRDPISFSLTNAPSGLTLQDTTNTNIKRVVWTTTPADIGTHQVTVNVADGNGGMDSETITLIITPNQAPAVVVTQGILLAKEGQLTTEARITATDANNDPIIIQGSSGLTFIGRVFSLFDRNLGLRNFLRPLPSGMTIMDTTNTNIKRVHWNPAFTTVRHVTGNIGFNGFSTFMPVQFRACEDLGNGQIGLCSDWEKITYHVEDTNQNVVITPGSSPDTATELQLYSRQIVAQDADTEDVLRYTIQAPIPIGMAVNSNGLLTWTPAINAYENSPIIGQPGLYPVTVVVSDGVGSTRSESWDINVIDLGNQNIPPDFTLTPVTVIAGQTATVTPQNVVDANGDTITFSLGTATNLPVAAVTTFDTIAGQLTWTNTVLGTYNVEIVADDGTDTTSRTTTITVNPFIPGNSAPTIDVIPRQTIAANRPLTFTVTARDTDAADSLTLGVDAVTGLPPGALFPMVSGNSVVNGQFTWTPTPTEVGVHTVTFVANDGVNPRITRTATIEVLPPIANQPPVITTVPVTTGRVGADYEYNVNAFDPDGDVLRYSLQQAADSNMEINQQGEISWTPDEVGSYPVTVAVTDGVNTVTQSYTITVTQGRRSLEIASARILPEVVSPGDYVSINVRVDNEGGVDVEDLQVKATWYEYGLRRTSGEFDLDHGEEKSENFGFIVPYEAQPGIYDLRIWVGNDYFHDTAYRQVVVR